MPDFQAGYIKLQMRDQSYYDIKIELAFTEYIQKIQNKNLF